MRLSDFPEIIREICNITIPEGAKTLQFCFTERVDYSITPCASKSIPLPKKKVKKWKWWRKIGDVEIETTQHHTFEEMSRNNLVGEFWQKVEGSEIEQ